MTMSDNQADDTTGGAILSDGTPVASLIDVDNRTASLRLFSDPEVYQAEQRWLFSRTWNIVGHESEIPEPGDFRLRSIAGDSVIVARGRDGDISVMLNVCAHRGMQVCRAEAGNANSFRCPYHGWTFRSDGGNLLGIPFQKDMYGDELDKQSLGLRTARVELYAGMIFANWDHEAPPLDDFLGEIRWYLDTIFKRTDRGIECAGAPQRFHIRANWKAPSEQFCGADGYHVATLHRSMLEVFIGDDQTAVHQAAVGAITGVDIGSAEGHGVRTLDAQILAQAGTGSDVADVAHLTPMEFLAQTPPTEMPPELLSQLETHLTQDQIAAMASHAPFTGGVFPNVGFVGLTFRVHVPTGHDSFEMLNFVMVERDATPEFKSQVRRQSMMQFGTSGLAEQDDSEAWLSIQSAASGFQGSQQDMHYHGFAGHHPPDGWKGGAEVYPGISRDDSAWHFWLRYRAYMRGTPLELGT